jgi:DNA-binding NtrC family response regulator
MISGTIHFKVTKLNILIALKSVSEELSVLLGDHDVRRLGLGDSILQAVAQGGFHLVLAEGVENILPDLKQADPRAEVVAIGYGDDNRVDTLKHGAFAYLTAPLDVRALTGIVDDVADAVAIRNKMAQLDEQLDEGHTFAGIVGRNPKILDIISFVKRIAPYYKAVLITGETGTGKEVVARALHDLSSKLGDPFVTSNCAGYVETLIESELFGHQKGSFTGAVSDKIGLFEAAKEGTLFLDEIGDLPLSFQPHLLRVLQNGEFRPVGSHRVLRARCRIIAATSKDLREEVNSGRFREDLFYRITPLVITMPPLRERKDDILLLCRFLVKRYSEQTGKLVKGISRPAQDMLLSHDWPGNVRELENVIHQAVILTEDSFLSPGQFPLYVKGAKGRQIADGSSLDGVVRRHIESVLEECRGNRSRAAKKLAISRRALLRKIEKYSLK